MLEDEKIFHSIATLTVPEEYTITANLDSSSASDFDKISVKFWFKHRDIDYEPTCLVAYRWGTELLSDTAFLYAGTYDVEIAVVCP